MRAAQQYSGNKGHCLNVNAMADERIAGPEPEASGSSQLTAGCLFALCTRSPTEVCQLLSNLAVHNRVLWHIDLHLREDHRDDVGELSVVKVPGIKGEAQYKENDRSAQYLATAVLRHLFEVHRCIVAVEVNDVVARTNYLLRALSATSSLKRVTVLRFDDAGPISTLESWLVTVFNLTGKRVFLSRTDSTCIGASLNAVAILLQRADPGIKALDLAALDIPHPALRRRIISALHRNRTIEELAVSYQVFTCTSATPCTPEKPFARYLTRNNPTLRKLTIKARHLDTVTHSQLTGLIRALSRLSTLEELNLEVHFRTGEYERLAQVVADSTSLRSFSMRYAPCCQKWSLRTDVLLFDTYQAPRPWLWAIRISRSLREVTVDMSWCRSSQCADFIRGIAHRSDIDRVTLLNVSAYGGLAEICRELRGYAPHRKVVVDTLHVGQSAFRTLLNSPEVNSVALNTHPFWQAHDLAAALGALRTCNHVTSLCLRLDCFTEDLYGVIEFYVRDVSTLRDLELYLFAGCYDESNERCIEGVAAIAEAASANRNISKLALRTVALRAEHYRRLADRVLENEGLRELSVIVLSFSFSDIFLSRLLPGLRSNYNLVRLELGQTPGGSISVAMATAQNIVQRNRSIERRAIRFVMGDHDPYFARVVELAAERPGFARAVAAEAGVAEVAATIQQALRLVRLTDMNEYMKITGVVKRRVCCEASDGRKQLTDLPRDFLLRVRQHLKLADVLTDI
ncbi:hypothetical protein HPB50_005620 [Hyalomma asiaticum]|uniref:Uncharacterized protein n=1 Tax=Hyalomma asiaticum TaxID=266040 RepID=A0ACB7RVN0_HYAAI|nr:hypothetical protein HPB50_005620 [Hyalomma asiaticum]